MSIVQYFECQNILLIPVMADPLLQCTKWSDASSRYVTQITLGFNSRKRCQMKQYQKLGFRFETAAPSSNGGPANPSWHDTYQPQMKKERVEGKYLG